MPETILITSGKGGVGKSTVCTLLGCALAMQGQRVLLLETDCGLRNLDIMNGVEDQAVYDLADVLIGQCEPIKAILKSKLAPNLFLIPASNKISYIPQRTGLEILISGLEEYYDMILVDTPAGFSPILDAVMSVAKKAIVVATPDAICVRDAARAASILRDAGILKNRLIINRVPKKFVPTKLLPDLDAVIDTVCLQLLGVIPEDISINNCLSNVTTFPPALISQIFDAIAWRVRGKNVPLNYF